MIGPATVAPPIQWSAAEMEQRYWLQSGSPPKTPIMVGVYLLGMLIWPFIQPVTPIEKEA